MTAMSPGTGSFWVDRDLREVEDVELAAVFRAGAGGVVSGVRERGS